MGGKFRVKALRVCFPGRVGDWEQDSGLGSLQETDGMRAEHARHMPTHPQVRWVGVVHRADALTDTQVGGVSGVSRGRDAPSPHGD